MAAYNDAQREQDYKLVFLSTPEGRRVLSDIMRKANVFAPCSHPDIYEAMRMEGARQLALFINSFLAFDKRAFHEVTKEASSSLFDL